MHDRPTPSTFHLPDDIHYDCIRCGFGCGLSWCGRDWFVEVTEEEAERILKMPAEDLGEARAPHHPVYREARAGGRHAMRMENGVCCMLTQQNLCAIHAAYGEGAKPNTCRSFPFRLVATPGGVFVGVSFMCTAVVNNQGRLLTEHRDAIEAMHRWTRSRRRVEEPMHLSTELPLSWPQYKSMEADLADLMDPALGPLGERLLLQAIYLRLLLKFLREARQQAGAAAAGPDGHAQPLEIFRARVRKSPERPWALLRNLAARRRPRPLLRRLFLGYCHAARNVLGRRRNKLAAASLLISKYIQHVLALGRIELPFLDRPVPYRRLRRIVFDPAQPEHDALLTRYFRHCLFRKDLLLEESIVFGIDMLLLRWGMIHWYAAATAAAAGHATVTPSDLREALRTVERFFGYHSDFSSIFRDHPYLRSITDRMFEHPLYAFSLARGEWWRSQ